MMLVCKKVVLPTRLGPISNTIFCDRGEPRIAERLPYLSILINSLFVCPS
jgi:hypothetical protein